MNYITITKAQAEARNMQPVTSPEPRDSEFLASVINDMRKVPGTHWALVQSGLNAEVWRVPITSLAITQTKTPTLI